MFSRHIKLEDGSYNFEIFKTNSPSNKDTKNKVLIPLPSLIPQWLLATQGFEIILIIAGFQEISQSEIDHDYKHFYPFNLSCLER
jgi:hypothetical protein